MKGLVIVREQLADVPGGDRAQHGVHHGVGQHIGVGVAVQPALPRDGNAAQDQGPALRQTVYVVPVADPQRRHCAASRWCRMASATARSVGVVILMFPSSPAASHTCLPSRSTAPQSSVTVLPENSADCSAAFRILA